MKNMVKKFQCPGCVNGSDPDTCDCVKINNICCVNHVLATSIQLNNLIALGLPKGFNKPGKDYNGKCLNRMNIRLIKKKEKHNMWDKFNIPVWALEQDGYLFVRTFSPRINMTFVDVIEEGTIDILPWGVVNVGTFINMIN